MFGWLRLKRDGMCGVDDLDGMRMLSEKPKRATDDTYRFIYKDGKGSRECFPVCHEVSIGEALDILFDHLGLELEYQEGKPEVPASVVAKKKPATPRRPARSKRKA